MMRAWCLAGVTVVAMALGGCATDVDESVQQIPDPGQAKDPPAQTLSGDLLQPISEPYLRELKGEAGHATKLPPRQTPVNPVGPNAAPQSE